MAKKAKSTLINMLLSLTLIALVAAGALALVNNVTEEPIKIAKENKVNKAIRDVLMQVNPNGDTTKIVFDTIVNNTIKIGDPNEEGKYKDSVVCHLAYTSDNEYVGAAVEAMDFNGFGGTLKVMVGFDANGDIYGYQVLESSETPGLGAKAGKWFQNDGKGNIIGKHTADGLEVKKDGGDVDAISGSTITSRAFLRCINKAYTNLQTVLNK